MEDKIANSLQQNFAGALAKASLEEGTFPQETLDLTQENLNFIYNMANQLYQQNQYQKAEELFRFLCTLKPTEQSYWFGLGATCQMEGKYKQAIFAYKFASTLDIEDPESAFHAAECHLKLNQIQEARDGLEIALMWAEQNSDYSHMVQKAEGLLQKITKEV